MGTVRSPLKEKAIQMRLKGHSYNDIQKRLNLPSKGTLSCWFRSLQLSPEAQSVLRDRTVIASTRNLLKFNVARSKRIKSENIKAFRDGQNRIGSLTKRELMLIGAALYWGEGTKSDNLGRLPSLAFTNSDPTMVKVYLRFVRKIFKVPSVRTGLPKDRFYVTTMVSRLSAGKRNPRLLPHGTLALRVCDRKLFHHMKGMIRGLFDAKLE